MTKSSSRAERAKRRKAEQDPWEWLTSCLGVILLIGMGYGLGIAAVIALLVWLCMSGLWPLAAGVLVVIFVVIPLAFSLHRRMSRRRH